MIHHANGGANSNSEEEKWEDGEQSEDPSLGTSALDPFFLLPALDAVPAWRFLQHPPPIPHAVQLLHICTPAYLYSFS